MTIIIIPIIFLNNPSVSASMPNFSTALCPRRTISSNTDPSPVTKKIKYTIPSKNEAGKIVASINKYVGLQEEKMGPREIPIITSPATPLFSIPLPRILLNKIDIFETNKILDHIEGNKNVIPTKNIKDAAKVCQNKSETYINEDTTWTINVNIIIETNKDPIIMNGLFLLPEPPITEPPITTGNNGNKQGANTVKKPATKEAITKETINALTNVIYYLFYITAARPLNNLFKIRINLNKSMFIIYTIFTS